MTEEELIMTSLLNCRRVDLVSEPRELTVMQKSQYDHMLKRKAQGEPLQYILGHCEFLGLPLTVDKRVLIPRPETEIMVEFAIKKLQLWRAHNKLNILDLGTGSGNIAISIAKNILNSLITAVDIEEGALVLALKNAQDNRVDQKIDFVHKDIAVYLRETITQHKMFNIIISNPPYIATDLMAHLPIDVQQEPFNALHGGANGLEFYLPIIEYSHQVLKEDGLLICEIADGQRNMIEYIFKKFPQYKNVIFQKDYVGTDRIVCART